MVGGKEGISRAQPASPSVSCVAIFRSPHCCKSLEPQCPLTSQEVLSHASIATKYYRRTRLPSSYRETLDPTYNTSHILTARDESVTEGPLQSLTGPSRRRPPPPSLPRTDVFRVQSKVSDKRKIPEVCGAPYQSGPGSCPRTWTNYFAEPGLDQLRSESGRWRDSASAERP